MKKYLLIALGFIGLSFSVDAQGRGNGNGKGKGKWKGDRDDRVVVVNNPRDRDWQDDDDDRRPGPPAHAKAWGRRAKDGQTNTRNRVKYFYYPQQGIYWDRNAGVYRYWDGDSWVRSNRRPRTFVVGAQPQVVYLHNGATWTTMPAPTGLTINFNR